MTIALVIEPTTRECATESSREGCVRVGMEVRTKTHGAVSILSTYLLMMYACEIVALWDLGTFGSSGSVVRTQNTTMSVNC
jgi:hypothetical protein